MIAQNFRAKKSLGQNFLTNPRVVDRIVAAANISSLDHVLEIGPGKGALTDRLLEQAGKVTAIEKDTELFEFLKDKYGDNEKLELHNADALDFIPPATPYLLIANIPYYITSPLLDHFLRYSQGTMPTRAVIMMQKEVAEKICAQPPDMNVLALHIRPFGNAKILFDVERGNFSPKPKVTSAVVEINVAPNATPPPRKYFSLIHIAFAQKRKMLHNSVGAELCAKANIDSTRRPTTLSMEEWMELANLETE